MSKHGSRESRRNRSDSRSMEMNSSTSSSTLWKLSLWSEKRKVVGKRVKMKWYRSDANWKSTSFPFQDRTSRATWSVHGTKGLQTGLFVTVRGKEGDSHKIARPVNFEPAEKLSLDWAFGPPPSPLDKLISSVCSSACSWHPAFDLLERRSVSRDGARYRISNASVCLSFLFAKLL